MNGEWRLINGTELYNVKTDQGQIENIADKYPERVAAMNAFYDTWWDDVIKETKYSIIDLGVDKNEVLTCHDARTVDYLPPWNQEMIRKGEPMKPAPFSVNFVAGGTYKFTLARWPEESGLALGAVTTDARPGTVSTDERLQGKAMKFVKAYLKIGEKLVSVDVNNQDKGATIEFEVQKGNTELLAYFDLANGTQTNAFYINVEKIK